MADQQSTYDPKQTGTTDSELKEFETKETIEELYHSWLGEKVVGGVWIRDESLKRLMNEEGASVLITNIKTRFNTNMHFAVLDEQQIKRIVGETGIDIMNSVLMYDYWKYEIEPTHITSIANQITHSLEIWLTIAWQGGMRKYKADKTRTVINKIVRSNEDE